MEKCPMCEKGKLKRILNKEIIHGVYLGTYPAKKCTYCGETFTSRDTMEKIEKKAKEKRVWGLGRKTKITKTGNSLAIRIPKKLADYLKLKNGKEAFIHPEDHRLIIETEY